MVNMRPFTAFEQDNLKFLVNHNVKFTQVEITPTGLGKGILDSTAPMRAYFIEEGVHNYEEQLQGQEHKVMRDAVILTETGQQLTQASFYRPTTKKGDPRMWIYKLGSYTEGNDIHVLFYFERKLYSINITHIDIATCYNSPIMTPIKEVLMEINHRGNSVSEELLGKFRSVSGQWFESEVMADTGIGRTVETVLGIPMNDSKQPDYKGIELKSKREKSNVRSNLFTQSPNWPLSRLKSSKAIVERYGYIPEGYNHKSLHVTLSALKPNPQGLGLNVDYGKDWLEANEYALTANDEGIYKKLNDVSVWQLIDLHDRLLTKHHETFWIDVDSRVIRDKEFFRVTTIEHTKNPIPSQFDILLEQGKITVDFLLCRDSGGDTYSFKVGKKDRALLFPESELYIINDQ